jgi:hypothetical protein
LLDALFITCLIQMAIILTGTPHFRRTGRGQLTGRVVAPEEISRQPHQARHRSADRAGDPPRDRWQNCPPRVYAEETRTAMSTPGDALIPELAVGLWASPRSLPAELDNPAGRGYPFDPGGAAAAMRCESGQVVVLLRIR